MIKWRQIRTERKRQRERPIRTKEKRGERDTYQLLAELLACASRRLVVMTVGKITTKTC